MGTDAYILNFAQEQEKEMITIDTWKALRNEKIVGLTFEPLYDDETTFRPKSPLRSVTIKTASGRDVTFRSISRDYDSHELEITIAGSKKPELLNFTV